MARIYVGRGITQVKVNESYDGTLMIGRLLFKFELRFPMPLPELIRVRPTSSSDEIRRIIPFVLRKEDKSVIELSDQRYAFFARLILNLAVMFSINPETKVWNDSPVFAQLGVKLSYSGDMIPIEVPEDIFRFLAEGLGCQFV